VRPNQEAYAVLGAVVTPGTMIYPEDKELNILTALSMAGGQTQTADLKKAILVRPSATGGQPEITPINLWAMSKGDLSQNITIKPGDVLFLPDKGGSRRGTEMLTILPSLALLLRR